MTAANDGNTVKVHYTGKLEDGTEFDSSKDRAPLEFTIGTGMIIPGFEQAVIGMSPGEAKTAKIAAAEAYGPHRQDQVFVVERSKFPDHITPQLGQRLEIRQTEGTIDVTVTSVTESDVTLDANHPLAGQDLIFDIELVEVV
jgi:peptidylprolyl isomerase